MIEAQGIHKRYGDVEVLKGIDLSIAQGEVVSIVGASGAGKTTRSIDFIFESGAIALQLCS